MEDNPTYLESYRSDLTLKRPWYQPVNLARFVSYGIARVLWLNSALSENIGRKFLSTVRDRETFEVEVVAVWSIALNQGKASEALNPPPRK